MMMLQGKIYVETCYINIKIRKCKDRCVKTRVDNAMGYTNEIPTLGHSEIQTTMDIYVSATDEFNQRETKSFEDYMNSSILAVSGQVGIISPEDVLHMTEFLKKGGSDYI